MGGRCCAAADDPRTRPRHASTYTFYAGLQGAQDRADDSVAWAGLPGGLQATYFDDADLSPASAVSSRSAYRLDWSSEMDSTVVTDLSNDDAFSVRWVGFAQPAYAAEYTFFVELLLHH